MVEKELLELIATEFILFIKAFNRVINKVRSIEKSELEMKSTQMALRFVPAERSDETHPPFVVMHRNRGTRDAGRVEETAMVRHGGEGRGRRTDGDGYLLGEAR